MALPWSTNPAFPQRGGLRLEARAHLSMLSGSGFSRLWLFLAVVQYYLPAIAVMSTWASRWPTVTRNPSLAPLLGSGSIWTQVSTP